MTVWNVLAAAGASWLAGILWYRAFAAARAAAGGVAPARPLRVAAAGVLVLFVAAGFLRHIYVVSGLTEGVPLGLVAGLGIGLFFIGPWLWVLRMAEGRALRLTLIDGGYASVATAIMGALLVAF